MKRLSALGQKSVSSNFSRFKTVSEEKLKELKQNQLKKRTFAKMMWGVNTYREWRNHVLSRYETFDVRILEANIDKVACLSAETFMFAMCKFVAEVTKQDGSEYPGKTLYHLVISVQKYLNQEGLEWKLVESKQFLQLRNVLDNTMKDRASRNIGTSVKKAEYMSLEFEDSLWKKGVLGVDKPDKLRNTVCFLLGMNLGLRAGDEHYDLRRDTLEKPSQLQFKVDTNGIKCLVYKEDLVTKTNDGGLKHMRKQRKVVWVHPSENINRDPVRLVEKYISLCPPISVKTKKFNFYLRSLEKPTPTRWYGEQIVGANSIRSTVKELLKDAKVDCYMTNHSLRRSSATRLFQNGVDRKLVKEFTGHVSDAVDTYQETSDTQRAQLSKVIQGQNVKDAPKIVNEANLQVSVTEKSEGKCVGCSCNRSNMNVKECDQIGELVNKLITSRKSNKATIKIEVEFHE